MITLFVAIVLLLSKPLVMFAICALLTVLCFLNAAEEEQNDKN